MGLRSFLDVICCVQSRVLGWESRKAGRIAVLTNFREDVTPPPSAISRGAIIKDFLKTEGPSRNWVKQMVSSGKGRDVGGFSLVCGQLAASSGEPENEGLAVFSNRVKVEGDVEWIFAKGGGSQAVGLSNGPFKGMPTDGGADEDTDSWKKVTDGQTLMNAALRQSQEVGEGEDQLIQRLLGLLSTDTLPRTENETEDGLETYTTQLRNTIFVPAIGRKGTPQMPPDELAAARNGGEGQCCKWNWRAWCKWIVWDAKANSNSCQPCWEGAIL